jgi:hypothetical protein
MKATGDNRRFPSSRWFARWAVRLLCLGAAIGLSLGGPLPRDREFGRSGYAAVAASRLSITILRVRRVQRQLL